MIKRSFCLLIEDVQVETRRNVVILYLSCIQGAGYCLFSSDYKNNPACLSACLVYLISKGIPGADPGFQVRRAHLKKLGRAEGGAKIFGE
jgi:hypothetical protein